MGMQMRCFIVVAVVAVSSCEGKPRLVDNSDETGTTSGSSSSGGESSGSDASGSNGSGATSSAAELGVSGILVFEPVPDFLPESQALLTVFETDRDLDDADVWEIAELTLPVATSPTPFFIPVDREQYDADLDHYVVGRGDMDGDEKDSCGDYADVVDVDPESPEAVVEVVLEFTEAWCP